MTRLTRSTERIEMFAALPIVIGTDTIATATIRHIRNALIIAGRSAGSTIRNSVRTAPAPASFAASSSPLSRLRIELETTR